jgi:hypothetical protein
VDRFRIHQSEEFKGYFVVGPLRSSRRWLPSGLHCKAPTRLVPDSERLNCARPFKYLIQRDRPTTPKRNQDLVADEVVLVRSPRRFAPSTRKPNSCVHFQLLAEGANPIHPTQATSVLTAERGKQALSGTIGVTAGTTSFDVVFSGPIGEGDDVASPLSLDRLANGATVRFGFTSGNAVKRRLRRADIDAITEVCQELGMGDDCDPTDIEDPGDRARFIRQYLHALSFYWGAHLKANRAKFTYSLDEDLTDTEATHVRLGGAVSVGFLLPSFWFVVFR